ncbi:hypothetical protein [Natrononativus amylolyticus]|uniref:hypothetical protein n=1 Tax=Natrononativus amylolyticus TaxID=2963434 RepID=UPI0020CF2330|nr:hypothetical protein [Natrononativus amylolyticus]
MNTAKLKPVYLIGIVLNIGALAFALSTGSFLYASAFAFVIVYLAFRYRMLSA